MSVLFCDSNEELWHDKVEELGLKVISMPYLINDEVGEFDLGKNTDFKDFYNKMRLGATCLTQALNPQNYVDYFEPYLKAGQDILYIHFSASMSGTFEYMNLAIKELKLKYPKRSIKVVDTKSISIGASALVYEAAKLHKNGVTDDEVIEFVKNERQNYKAYFMVDDLNHLKRGGRISSTKALMGTMLNVKPILTINKDGKIEAYDKVKGRKKAILWFVNRLKQEGTDLGEHTIAIAHADSFEEAEFLENKIRELVGNKVTIWNQYVGPTIGTHCGPGTLAISFYSNKK